jgi:hypothetical protein
MWISFPVFPGVRVGTSTRGAGGGCGVFLAFFIIAIPIALAIQYWQWTLAIGGSILLIAFIRAGRNTSRDEEEMLPPPGAWAKKLAARNEIAAAADVSDAGANREPT